MGLERASQEESQIHYSWVPTSPFKPILPKPPLIYSDTQVNQIGQANWLESERCSLFFTQEPAARIESPPFESANGAEANARVGSAGVASGSSSCVSNDNSEGFGLYPIDPTADFSNICFKDLLALATAGSGFCPIATSPPNPSIGGNCTSKHTPNELNISHHSYDLNLPPGTLADTLFDNSMTNFAPITPDKSMRAKGKEVSETENSPSDDRTGEGRHQQESMLIATEIDSNTIQCSEELLKPVTIQWSENYNPGKGGDHVELNGTPLKKPRRRKHRPKVITEGKPNRVPKPVTPKPNGVQENSTGKRKYIRKNELNKDQPPPSAGASGENPRQKRKYVRKKGLNQELTTPASEGKEGLASGPETPAPSKKSCKRALNFDMEGPQTADNPMYRSSCNLDSESGAQMLWNMGEQSKSMRQLDDRIDMTVPTTKVGIVNDLNCSLKPNIKDSMSQTEGQAPSTPLPMKNNLPRRRRSAHYRKQTHQNGKDQPSFQNGQPNTANIMSQTTQLSPRSLDDSKCSTSFILEEEQPTRELKKSNSSATAQPDWSSMNTFGSLYNNLHAYQAFPWVQHIQKRKRTDKGHDPPISSMTTVKYFVPRGACLADNAGRTPQFDSNGFPTTLREARRDYHQNIMQTFDCIMTVGQTERLEKNKSRGKTNAQDLVSPSKMVDCRSHRTCSSSKSGRDCDKKEVGDETHKNTEDLVPMMPALARKKRTMRKNIRVVAASSSTSAVQTSQNFVLNNQNQCFDAPPDVTGKQNFSTAAIADQLAHLDMNREGDCVKYQEQKALITYNMGNEKQKALVVYGRDTTMVPFEGPFDPVKKRRQRPKVNLDEETNRVWKLLLGNINSEGIDGTNEEKANWWKEERRVFHGRANSFIARMHLVQGDRRFSQWKGSVVDSVVGVFLTQNVSDHLSSSAFMSLAAHFPLKSNSKDKPSHDRGTSLIPQGPEVYILDPDDTIQWNNNMPVQPTGDQSSITLHDSRHFEEKEVVDNIGLSGSSACSTGSTKELKYKLLDCSGSGFETCSDSIAYGLNEITGRGTKCFKVDDTTNNALSSQNSVVSPQNFVDSSISQLAERTGSCLESNLKAAYQAKDSGFNIFNDSTSYVKLLEMAGSAMLYDVYIHEDYKTPSDENSKFEGKQFQNNQRQNMENLVGPKSFSGEITIPSANYNPHLIPNPDVIEAEHSEMYNEETRSSEMLKTTEENGMQQRSPLTEESACQATDQNDLTESKQMAPQCCDDYDQSSNNIQQNKHTIAQYQSQLLGDHGNFESSDQVQNKEMQRHVNQLEGSGKLLDSTENIIAFDHRQKVQESGLYGHGHLSGKELNEMNDTTSKPKSRRAKKVKKDDFDWDSLRKEAEANGRKRERTENTNDSVDWEAVRCAEVDEIAKTIKERGMNNMLAERIKDFLNRLVKEHGSIDLEWLRDIPPDKAKEYLLSIRGLGLKSVECVRLLTLHHLAFPVDTNVGRIAVRLGWVPLQPLPESLQLHLLELYPVLESIQKYLWPRLCKLDQPTLYELHYQLITFGKVFCTKTKPNCNACPMRGECRHFASAFASARLALPGPEEKGIINANGSRIPEQNSVFITNQLPLPLPQPIEQSEENWQSNASHLLEVKDGVNKCEPIIEEPASPETECKQTSESDIEDAFCDDPDEIPTIKLNMEEFTQNLQTYMQKNMELQEVDMSKALVALTEEAASIPMPKLKNVSRLRTEHQVYELPDSHPLLKGLDKREPDDPCKYLLAIWTPGETANSIQPPERKCSAQEYGKLCDDKTCFSCNSVREAEFHIVRGTLLIPCRTAMRGSFPLNGTYFQVNEVFADHDSSLNPIDVPRDWIWDLPRRTVYFGTSIPSIFKGLTTEGIQHCFWRGHVCVRGFHQKTRAPRPLMARLHFPASKLNKAKGKGAADDD